MLLFDHSKEWVGEGLRMHRAWPLVVILRDWEPQTPRQGSAFPLSICKLVGSSPTRFTRCNMEKKYRLDWKEKQQISSIGEKYEEFCFLLNAWDRERDPLSCEEIGDYDYFGYDGDGDPSDYAD
jgi:hypothetical protein